MNGVMIALLPISAPWCKVDPPHMTLVYSGDVEDHVITELPNLIRDASYLAVMARPLTIAVTGLEVFGKDSDRVDVFTLRLTPELMAMRNFVEKWHRSEWSVYRPHVTIGPSPSMIMERPGYIAFNRVMVGVTRGLLSTWGLLLLFDQSEVNDHGVQKS